MKRSSYTEEPHAPPTSRALMEKGYGATMTSTPKLLAIKWITPINRTSTSDSEENQPPAKRRKPKKKPRKYEAQTVKTTTTAEIFQPPLIEYATSQSSLFKSKNFDQALKKQHEQLHVTGFNRGHHLINREVKNPINPYTSCGSSISSMEMSGLSSHSENVVQSAPVQLDHRNMEKLKNDSDMPMEVEDQQHRVICIEDYLAKDDAEQENHTETANEAENDRKRTISVEECELSIEMRQSTQMLDELEIETVDLSIDDQAEVEYENNVGHEMVPAKSLQPAAAAAAAGAAEQPQQIDDNDRSLAVMTKKSVNSFRRHKFKKTPKRLKALEEIKRLQGSVQLLIPKQPFKRLVHEIMTVQNSNNFHIQGTAMLALHEAAEKHLIELFEETLLLSLHRDRVTVALKDIQLACKLQEHYDLNHRFD